MTRPRDSQRAKVYAADRAMTGAMVQDSERFPDLDAVRRYVLKACDSKRVQARYPRAAKIALTPRMLRFHDGGGTIRGAAGWNYGAPRMRLPLWTRNEHQILHELAHVLVQSTDSWHGWEFCDGLLYLTLIVRGRAAHDELEAAYKAQRVRYRKPRAKRVLTPEQRAAAIERLQAAQHRVPETVDFWGLG